MRIKIVYEPENAVESAFLGFCTENGLNPGEYHFSSSEDEPGVYGVFDAWGGYAGFFTV